MKNITDYDENPVPAPRLDGSEPGQRSECRQDELGFSFPETRKRQTIPARSEQFRAGVKMSAESESTTRAARMMKQGPRPEAMSFGKNLATDHRGEGNRLTIVISRDHGKTEGVVIFAPTLKGLDGRRFFGGG